MQILPVIAILINMKTSIQGFKGSFHHRVAQELGLLNENDSLLERDDFKKVFNDVVSGGADLGIVAIENSIAGAILENFDMLKNSGLKVIGEYYLRIKLDLLGTQDATLADITEVRSHPMAFKQTQAFFSKHPEFKQVTHADTALAVGEVVEQNLKNVAGIAGDFAATQHNAKVLAEAVEDDHENFTRFLVVARHDNAKLTDVTYESTGQEKTSIYIETEHQPGALYEVLRVFHELKLNMSMLVSRPIKGEVWKYGFYIDFETDKFAEEMLRVKINHFTDTLLIFGAYPAFKREK